MKTLYKAIKASLFWSFLSLLAYILCLVYSNMGLLFSDSLGGILSVFNKENLYYLIPAYFLGLFIVIFFVMYKKDHENH